MNRSESKYFHTAVLMDQAFLELLDQKDFEYITVKEICEKAGVNRSTFYLHYETVADLLDESIEYMNRQFEAYFSNDRVLDIGSIESTDIDRLYLITPQYVTPYLHYVRDHRRLFRIAVEKSSVLGSDRKLNSLFEQVIGPIMQRYHVAEEKQPFLLSFYIHGIAAVLTMWVEHDCRESIEFISDTIAECIKSPYLTENPKKPT